jgi:hypothetical protein
MRFLDRRETSGEQSWIEGSGGEGREDEGGSRKGEAGGIG